MRKTDVSHPVRCRRKCKQCTQNETNGNDVVRGFMGNGEMYREKKRKRKRIYIVNKSSCGEEKIISLVIYIFHKYSLSREKVKPERGRWTSRGRRGRVGERKARVRIFG